jgi:hypothetical protein
MFVIIVLVLGVGGGACDFGMIFSKFCANFYIFSFLFTLVFFQAIHPPTLLFHGPI